MRGKTVIFSFLFLPLWLAAVTFSISAIPFADADDQVSRSPDGQAGQNAPGKDLPPPKHAAHHVVRRAAFSGSGDDLLSGVAPTSTLPNRPQLHAALFSLAEAPADLRHCWQFHLRSAAEPRAPSLAS